MNIKNLRTGTGFDSHRLELGRKLILGGVEIPYKRGFAGHSDGDMLCHAVIDALLGVAGMGDIGQRFPDTDEKWKDADSLKLLEIVATELEDRIAQLINIDITVILQQPKIAPYKQKIIDNLSDVLAIEPERISIKGKTNEGMGFTGRGEGGAVIVSCLVMLK